MIITVTVLLHLLTHLGDRHIHGECLLRRRLHFGDPHSEHSILHLCAALPAPSRPRADEACAAGEGTATIAKKKKTYRWGHISTALHRPLHSGS